MSLLSSLTVAAGALSAYTRVLEVAQNNVANASTPGYVAQVQTLHALAFDPASGLTGGVAAGEIQSERNQYADQQVRQQNTALGYARQQAGSLTSLENVFDISGQSGIATALGNLFDSFSAWAQSPTSAVARQTVLQRAGNLAAAFQQTAANLTQAEQNAETQVTQTVDTINSLVGQLQSYNTQVLGGNRNNAGLDAQIHATLEQLSQYVSFTALNSQDGSVSILMNGQTPLLVGNQQYQISAAMQQPSSPPPVYAQARPPVQILASDGSDITSASTGGQLGALLGFRNGMLPSLLGDAYQQGQLNQMAQQFADRVNQLLTGGQAWDGTVGVPLFTYDATNPTSIASGLAVDPNLTADQLVAADPGPPFTANGVALTLSGMGSPQDGADEINGESFTQFYAGMAAQVGNALEAATNQTAVQESAVAQARNLQQQMSGVSLDQEAMMMIQFQRAYEANAHMITILDQLAQDTINMMRT